jgi:hypothetical protein
MHSILTLPKARIGASTLAFVVAFLSPTALADDDPVALRLRLAPFIFEEVDCG